MRLSEVIALYLAAAAPFGVAFFLRRRAAAPRGARALAASALAGLAWPVTSLLLLPRRGARVRTEEKDAASLSSERAERAAAASLAEVESLLEAAAARPDQRVRYALFAARRGVERFAGLARVSRGARADAAPTARDLELPRVAGRRGEDLALAGRCAHRRNVLRLRLHRERARGEMLHALAELRELAPASEASAPALSLSLARAYEMTLELLSELDDERAAEGVRRLLEAERARARRLQALADGGESCTTQAAATASAASRPRQTSTSSHA